MRIGSKNDRQVFTIQSQHNMEGESSTSVSGESSSNFTVPSSEDSKAKRKQYIAKRDSTKVALYEQFQRWRSVKELLNFKTDKELTEILLDNYEKCAKKSCVFTVRNLNYS